MNEPAAIHVFRAGTHIATDGQAYTFSEADIADLVESYDPALSDAPLVVGHPEVEDPAYGWAASLRHENGNVYAVPRDVEPQFAEMVNAKRFPKISAAIYLPSTPGNPKPGHFYLRHIGFLGAAAPGVKGLRPASFASSEGAVEFAMPLASLGWALTDILRRLRDYFVERDGAEAADRVIPHYQISTIDQFTRDDPEQTAAGPTYAAPAHSLEMTMSDPKSPQFAEREQQLTTREQQLSTQATEIEARERALAQREAQARREDAVAFAEGLVQAGKLLPRQKAPIVELLLVMPASTSVNFAEGGATVDKPAGEVLRELLDGLPTQVDFTEKSAGEAVTGTATFAAPPGVIVDAGLAELHAKAKRFQQQNPNTSWMDAVAAVGG